MSEQSKIERKFDELLEELSTLNAEYELKVNNAIQKLSIIAEIRSISISTLSQKIRERIRPLYDN